MHFFAKRRLLKQRLILDKICSLDESKVTQERPVGRILKTHATFRMYVDLHPVQIGYHVHTKQRM